MAVAHSDPRPTTAQLRRLYKPTKIKTLFIGESPPDPSQGNLNYFYNAASSFGNFGCLIRAAGVDPKIGKAAALRAFMEAGCYLVDATETPVDKLVDAKQRPVLVRQGFVDQLDEIKLLLVDRPTVIVLGRMAEAACRVTLEQMGHRVHYAHLPGQGWQNRSLAMIKEAMQVIG